MEMLPMNVRRSNYDHVAREVYQRHIDHMSRALLSGDFEAFADRLSYPHLVRTLTNRFVVQSRDENRPLFFGLHASMQTEGVTDLIRLTKDARFESDDEIIGVHITHKLKGGVRLLEPYENRIRLVREDDGVWRETHSSNAIENKADKFDIPVVPTNPGPAPDLDTNTKRKPR